MDLALKTPEFPFRYHRVRPGRLPQPQLESPFPGLTPVSQSNSSLCSLHYPAVGDLPDARVNLMVLFAHAPRENSIAMLHLAGCGTSDQVFRRSDGQGRGENSAARKSSSLPIGTRAAKQESCRSSLRVYSDTSISTVIRRSPGESADAGSRSEIDIRTSIPSTTSPKIV